MARFNVGDRARLVFSELYPERIGETCTIIGLGVYDSEDVFYDYTISFDNIPDPSLGGDWAVMVYQLEPLIELGSWKEIEKAIKWNPMKENNYVD